MIAVALYLIDSADVAHLGKLEHKKRISIARIDKLMHSMPTVPLFGDMQVCEARASSSIVQISPFVLVRRATHYEASRWPLCDVESVECPVDLANKLSRARVDHQVRPHVECVRRTSSSRST